MVPPSTFASSSASSSKSWFKRHGSLMPWDAAAMPRSYAETSPAGSWSPSSPSPMCPCGCFTHSPLKMRIFEMRGELRTFGGSEKWLILINSLLQFQILLLWWHFVEHIEPCVTATDHVLSLPCIRLFSGCLATCIRARWRSLIRFNCIIMWLTYDYLKIKLLH